MLLHLLNSLAKCDLSRTRTNREPSLRSGRHLSSHVSTDSCFAFSVRHFLHCVLRTVHVWGTVGSSTTLVCSSTKFTENVVLMSTPTCHADVTMRRDICFFDERKCLLMLVFCWNPAVSVLLVLVRRPLVPRPPYFLCRVGGIAKSCCRDFSSG